MVNLLEADIQHTGDENDPQLETEGWKRDLKDALFILLCSDSN